MAKTITGKEAKRNYMFIKNANTLASTYSLDPTQKAQVSLAATLIKSTLAGDATHADFSSVTGSEICNAVRFAGITLPDVVNTAIAYFMQPTAPDSARTPIWYVLNEAELRTSADGKLISFKDRLKEIPDDLVNTYNEMYTIVNKFSTANISDEPFCLIVAGSRGCNFEEAVYTMINTIIKQHKASYDNMTIMEGAANGPDKYARKFAKKNNITLQEFAPDWSAGLKGGIIRTARIHEESKKYNKRACLCVWDGESKGTLHNFRFAIRNRTPLYVYNYKTVKWLTADEIMRFAEADGL